MAKKSTWALMIVGAMFFAWGCGSDSNTNNNKKDGSTIKDSANTSTPEASVNNIEASVAQNDLTLATADTSIKNDTGVKKDATQVKHCSPPKAATANSGRIGCSDSNKCPTGESCVAFEEGKDFCVGTCCMNPDKEDDVANICPVANKDKQTAYCWYLVTDENDVYLDYDICAYVCATKKTDGTWDLKNVAEACPSDKYKCAEPDDATSKYRFCAPQ